MKSGIKYWLLALLALFVPWSTAHAGLEVSGFVRNYTGLLLENADFAIIQNTFEPTLEYTGDKGAVKVTPYVYQYINQPIEFGLRQAYVDLFFEHADLRVGHQQIIWGKADGVFITDILSPKDLSEFLLREFEEIRQGITAVKTNFYIGDHTLELVWSPVFTPTKLPAAASIWRPAMTLDLPIQPTWDRSNEAVKFSAKSSEVFGKFAAMTSLVDFEIMGGYMYDDDPSIHIKKTINPATKMVSSVTLAPEHHRLILGGASFSTTVWGFVLRGEGAFYAGKQYNTSYPGAKEGLVEKNYIHYLLGLDKTVFGVRLSTQFVQRIILDYENRIFADKIDNTMTFLASTDFLQENLKIDFFAYVGINNADALLRSKVSYSIMDGLNVLAGFDSFVGTTGQFGQFNNNDMIYTKVKYTF